MVKVNYILLYIVLVVVLATTQYTSATTPVTTPTVPTYSAVNTTWIQKGDVYGKIASTVDLRYIVSSNHGGGPGTTDSGVWLSRDNGTTWSKIRTGDYYFEPSISQDGRIVVGQNNGKIFVSNNLGNTWIQRYWGGINAPMVGTSYYGEYMYLGGTDYLYYGSGYFMVSSNYGSDWSRPSSAPVNHWWGMVVSSSGQCIYAKLSMGLMISNDYGLTWSDITPPAFSIPGVSSITASKNFEYIFASNPGTSMVMKSTDLGQSWTSVRVDSPFGIIKCSETCQYLAAVSYDSSVFTIQYSSDYGQLWTKFIRPSGPSCETESIVSNGLIISGNGKTIMVKCGTTIYSTSTLSPIPTTSPTASPTNSPTTSPTASPTNSPTTSPTASPIPTTSPTQSPSASPTPLPTLAKKPTRKRKPTKKKHYVYMTHSPSRKPTRSSQTLSPSAKQTRKTKPTTT
jgi:photosystem II stability/assembly factor-like uncharacterized protein